MRSVLTILAGACCASLALAQPATRAETGSSTTTASYHRITTVVGTAFSLGTENVGKVVDVVFNDGGCIDYVLVQDAEGFIPVPWSVITVNYDQKVVTVQSSTVTIEKLREVRFTEARLPNFSDPAFTSKVEGVWGKGASRSGSGRTGSGSGTGTTTPDRKSGTTTPPAKDSGTITPDRKGGTTPPPTEKPGTTTPPAKDNPKNPPKKEKDKDGK